MNIVTLTTDFGWKDYYVGVLKGKILSQGTATVFADITHQIENYNIVQAAFVVRNSYKSFPKGSIHLVSVNNVYAPERHFLAIEHEGHYFVGPDNGIFSLLFEQLPEKIYRLPKAQQIHALDVNDYFAYAVNHIFQKQPFAEIGTPVRQILQRFSLRPILSRDQIRGSVIHVDNYGNVILNIDRELFFRGCKGRNFEIYFKRFDPITIIHEQYSDVPVGEVLCLFNSANYLEIAVNMGKASTLFGLDIDDSVQIDFF
ncbi:MAG: SAM-dependent chlorinase/fluorinase [Saprospiraceae bacterium]|nr:SAM-dependent chlorinase/fluorinase [Saprospiraceae bacterium]